MRPLRAHLDSVGEGYFQHFCHAAGFSTRMFAGAAACLVHALLPFLFETTGSRCIATLHERMTVRRRAPTTTARATPTRPAARSAGTARAAPL